MLPKECPADILNFLTHCGYNIVSADSSSPLQLRNSRGDLLAIDPTRTHQDVLQQLSNFVQPPT